MARADLLTDLVRLQRVRLSFDELKIQGLARDLISCSQCSQAALLEQNA